MANKDYPIEEPLASGDSPKEIISGKKLKDAERSANRAKKLKEYTELSKDSGALESALNVVDLSGNKSHGLGVEGRKKAKAAISRDLESYKKGGLVGSASKRADGCAIRGKTRA